MLPFWSPDSRYIGFFAGGKLKAIEASGGTAAVICDAPIPLGATWNQEGVIVFAPDAGSGPLFQVSASRGIAAPVTFLDTQRHEELHSWPSFLPDGRHFLYVASGGAEPALRVASLGSNRKDAKLVLKDAYNAVYAGGYLLFLRENSLMAQRFDLRSLVTRGDPVPVVDESRDSTGISDVFAASQNGLLVYRIGARGGGVQLAWFNRAGKQVGTVGDPAFITNIHLSPDGKQCSARIERGLINGDIWIFDVTRGVRTRLTFSPADERESAWSPDGKTIVFNSNRTGRFDLFQKSVKHGSTEELLYSSALDKYPNSFSPDGKFLLYESRADPKTKHDLWILPLTGERTPVPFAQTAFNEWRGQFSPDGRWIAYQSDESRRDEIYVAPFRCAEGSHCEKQQISTSGGAFPVWARDGQAIFYIGPDDRLMEAEVRTRRAAIQVGAVRPLFGPISQKAPGYRYDASPDGRLLATLTQWQTSSEPLTLVQNWTAGLNK